MNLDKNIINRWKKIEVYIFSAINIILIHMQSPFKHMGTLERLMIFVDAIEESVFDHLWHHAMQDLDGGLATGGGGEVVSGYVMEFIYW